MSWEFVNIGSYYDTAKPHTYLVNCVKLWKLGLEVKFHTLSNSDFTPSYNHLFQSLQLIDLLKV